MRGRLVMGSREEQWCDRHNFAELYRRAIALRREALAPADRATFYRFLLRWHKLGLPGQPLEELLKRYRGYQFPLRVFEREILRSRVGGEQFTTTLQDFHDKVARGEIIALAQRTSEDSRRYLSFILRGEGNMFFSKAELTAAAEQLDESAKVIYNFLRENGASLIRDLMIGANLSTAQIENGLTRLANLGLVNCDNYPAFLLRLQPQSSQSEASSMPQAESIPRPAWSSHDRQRRYQPSFRRAIRERVALTQTEGRWF
ncbi:hypothetical protein DCC62_24110, partial [candidate division KSB1 bacterium]